jgi:hypothetical protein
MTKSTVETVEGGFSQAVCECGWKSYFTTMFYWDAVDWAEKHDGFHESGFLERVDINV